MRKAIPILLTLLLGAFLTVDSQEAHGRDQYRKAMEKLYPDLLKSKGVEKNGKKKLECTVCHGKTKKKRNDYGQALAKALPQKKEKDADKIKKALEKIAKEDSSTNGKTFGDLIKADKLPGDPDTVK